LSCWSTVVLIFKLTQANTKRIIIKALERNMTVRVAHDVIEQPLKTSAQANELPRSQELNHQYLECKSDLDLDDDDDIILNGEGRFYVENIPFRRRNESCEYDYETSLCATSVSESFDDSVETSSRRSVSFLEPLVSEVRYRPRTPPEDCSSLFYSSEETKQFRRDYHMERSLEESANAQDQEQSCVKSYDISKVVVTASNSTVQYEKNPWKSSMSEPFELSDPLGSDSSDGGIFFDNDNFWTGSITWY